jgi:hypothetical protein
MGKGKPRHKLGYAEPLKLPAYDLIISNLIRMRSQGDNINWIKLNYPHILLYRNNGKIVIDNYYPKNYNVFECDSNYIYNGPIIFDNIQDAIEFNWKGYEEDRPLILSL